MKRLRTLLHTYTITVSETKGLEVVWMMLSDGQLCIDVATLCSASERMTGAKLPEDNVRAKLKELNIGEGTIDFDAFVKFFSTEKKDGLGITFNDIAVSYVYLDEYSSSASKFGSVDVYNGSWHTCSALLPPLLPSSSCRVGSPRSVPLT